MKVIHTDGTGLGVLVAAVTDNANAIAVTIEPNPRVVDLRDRKPSHG